MELFRQEVALRQGVNWGRVAFERSQARTQQAKCSRAAQRLVPAVADALKARPAGLSSVDLSDALAQLSDDEAATLFAQYKGCATLSIANWATPSARALRSLTLTLGSTLEVIDLSGSNISDEQFDTLVACASRLRTIIADRCPHIGGLSMQRLPGTLRHTLTSLSISACPRINSESFLWLTGGQGTHTPTCAKLQLLDISLCTGVNDTGVTAVAAKLKALRFLNLRSCSSVTDRSVVALGSGCRHLHVLNLEGLSQLTDSSVVHLAQHCTALVSLNLAQCSLLTDKAIVAVAEHCPNLQAISVAGVSSITERGFGVLARCCKGLLMMNATGCIELSGNGLRAMVQGLKFVELASSFYGFKPVEEATAKKLQAQLDIIHDKSATKIQRTVRGYYDNKLIKQRLRQQRLDNAATTITRAMIWYTKKLKSWRRLLARKSIICATEVQRAWRGYLGRRRADRRRAELKEFRAKTRYATLLQSVYRSHFQQRCHPEVAAAIEQLRVHRRREAETTIAVRMQSVVRAHVARIRSHIASKYFALVQRDKLRAIVTMQSVARMFLCKLQMRQLQLEEQRIFELRSKGATRIQQFVRASYGRYSASLRAAELRLMKRARLRAATNIQRFYRGYVARRQLFRLKAMKKLQIRAAIVIQKTFRGSRVLRWRAIQMNRAAAHILDRSVTEFMLRKQDCRTRRLTASPESDSSSDEEFPVASHRLRFANEPDPYQAWGGVEGLVEKFVRVYWPVEEQWYDGTVAGWDPKKRKHKIQYTDEDREWISLAQHRHRVQIWNQLPGEEGVWVPLDSYHTPESAEWLEEMKQHNEQAQRRAAAWQAVNQWQPIDQPPQQTSRYARLTARRLRRKYLWVSEVTGEVRTGRDDCYMWTVTADENGWPVFVHSETGEVSRYEPRFEDNQMEHKFKVLQDMRQAVYLCQDLLDRHQAAKPTEMRNVLREISRSDLRKQLQTFAIQARGLYTPKSNVDAPPPADIMQEIEAAVQLSMVLNELSDHAAAEEEKAQRLKATLLVTHPDKLETYLVCPHCHNETKQEYCFCQTCGKQQTEFERRTRPKKDTPERLSEAHENPPQAST